MKVHINCMVIRWHLSIVLLLFALCGKQVTARRYTMLPLKPREVYRLLHLSGNDDAVPEGRIVTHGLAAAGGFAAGITKAIGATFLYEIITANVTGVEGLEWYNNIWSGGNAATNSNSNKDTEICFNTRNARSLEEAATIAEAYNRDDDDDENESAKVRKSQAKRTKKKRKRNKNRGRRRKNKHRNGGRVSIGGGVENIDVGTNSAATIATGPDSNVETNNGNAVNVDEQSFLGTGTSSTSTTETDNDGAINCIVIQKSRY